MEILAVVVGITMAFASKELYVQCKEASQHREH